MKLVLATLVLAGCGNVASGLPDAPPGTPDAPGQVDGPSVDAPCVNTPIFVGGTDPVAQGWIVEQAAPATLSTSGPTITQLQTLTPPTGGTSGYLLLRKDGAVTLPFTIELEMQVTTVDSHNFLDGAAVLMGSYTTWPGTGVERGQMMYVDRDKVGWTDDTDSFAVSSLDNMFHTYRLAVDAGGNATVSRDGVQVLTRTAFTTNGTIAVGDQTNDAGVDSTLLIRSVSMICQ